MDNRWKQAQQIVLQLRELQVMLSSLTVLVERSEGQEVKSDQLVCLLRSLDEGIDRAHYLIKQPDYTPPSGKKVCDKCGQIIRT